MIVFDIGGHESRERDKEFQARLEAVLGGPVAYQHMGKWDVGSPQAADELRDSVVSLMRPLDRAADRGESVCYIMPGLSASVAAFLALIHGQMGHFPRMIWLVKDESGQYRQPVLLDLDDMREWAREHLRFPDR